MAPVELAPVELAPVDGRPVGRRRSTIHQACSLSLLVSAPRGYWFMDSSIALSYSSWVIPSVAGSTSSVAGGASMTAGSLPPQPVSDSDVQQTAAMNKKTKFFIFGSLRGRG